MVLVHDTLARGGTWLHRIFQGFLEEAVSTAAGERVRAVGGFLSRCGCRRCTSRDIKGSDIGCRRSSSPLVHHEKNGIPSSRGYTNTLLDFFFIDHPSLRRRPRFSAVRSHKKIKNLNIANDDCTRVTERRELSRLQPICIFTSEIKTFKLGRCCDYIRDKKSRA
jgi:hypothetical protein